MSKQIVDNITKGNKIIGKFMNLEEGKVISGKPIFIIDGSFYQYGHLQYHSSWDWLHGAWDKFSKLELQDFDFNHTYSNHLEGISNAITHLSIKTAFERLVRGITWYNSQPKT